MTIRIMLIDDHRMLREALVAPLAVEPDFDVVGQSGGGLEALNALERELPDILVLDIELPDISGIEVARRALARHPDLRVVILSGYADRQFVDAALKIGARAYVVKSAGTKELIFAIRAVLAGHVFLSPEITAAMLARSEGETSPQGILGRREFEVLRLHAQGLRSAEIGAQLGILPATVDVHRANIKKKLGLKSPAELTRYAIRAGLLPS